jgi:hypothetical protein
MNKISAIIVVAAICVFLAVIGCQKQETPAPVMESAMTSTAAVSAPTATAAMPDPAAK